MNPQEQRDVHAQELGEAWLARRVREQCGVDVYTGTTDTEIRRERIRAAIAAHELAAVVIGRGADGKPEVYSTLFQRLYKVPL